MSRKVKNKEYSPEDSAGSRRQYNSPQLVNYGDVRDVTLGGTPGTADSGDLMCVIGEPCITPPP